MTEKVSEMEGWSANAWLVEELLKAAVSNMKITSVTFTPENGALRVEAQCPMPVMLDQVTISLSAR